MSPKENSNRSHSQGDASRRRILDEATRLFGLYGYNAVTMREIGAAAGLDNSTIYRYFKGKHELAGAVVESVLKDLGPVIARLDPSREPSLDQLVETIVTFSRHLWERPSAARLLLAWMSTTGEERSGFSYSVNVSENPDHPASQMVRAVVKWIESAKLNGSIRSVAPVDAIVNVLALAVIRPATANYFLRSLDADLSEKDRQRTAELELEAEVRGALSPTRNKHS